VPGGGWSNKRWPIDRFFQIAQRLNAATGWEAVIVGGSDDTGLARQFSASASFPVTDRTGNTSILELVEIIRHAQLVVSNDTGSAHIAAAVDVCCASILGGAHFGRFLPYEVETSDRSTALHAVYHRMPCYGCNWRCVYVIKEGQPVPCVDLVSVNQVWETVKSMLQIRSANKFNSP
jgi:ADP-heptose:LPS heptosyltransferase